MTDGGSAAALPPEEKRVTWVELFFDLVFVLAVTQVSALLHDDVSWGGVVRALVVFVPVYWAWVGTTVHANLHDLTTPQGRLGLFVAGGCSLFMALAVPEAHGDHGVLFGVSYLALRLVLAVLVFPTYRRIPVNSFTVGLGVSGPLLVLGGLAEGDLRTGLWAMAALIDLMVPWLVRSRLTGLAFNLAHMPERFGLFLIVALGESIVAVGLTATAEPLGAERLTAVGTAYVLACGLWWVYFVFAADAIRHALVTASVKTEVVRSVLSYAHLAFISGIVAIAVGLGEVVAHPGETLPTGLAAILTGGCALYLATFGYTRWRMFRILATTRLTAAATCLVVLPLATEVPALVTLLLLASVLTALNVVEWVRVSGAQAAEASEAPQAPEAGTDAEPTAAEAPTSP